jgi:hypothetical protein
MPGPPPTLCGAGVKGVARKLLEIVRALVALVDRVDHDIPGVRARLFPVEQPLISCPRRQALEDLGEKSARCQRPADLCFRYPGEGGIPRINVRLGTRSTSRGCSLSARTWSLDDAPLGYGRESSSGLAPRSGTVARWLHDARHQAVSPPRSIRAAVLRSSYEGHTWSEWHVYTPAIRVTAPILTGARLGCQPAPMNVI